MRHVAPGDSAADAAGRGPRRADTLRTVRLAPTIVTGTRLSAVDARVPARVDRLAPELAPPGPAAAADMVARLPGVSVFLDGVRINDPDAQELLCDLIPVEAIASAELVRGPTALFGESTLAGALLRTTERGSAVPRAR